MCFFSFIHIDRLGIIAHCPNTTWAYPGTNSAAYAFFLIRYIFERSIFGNPADRIFRAGFLTHVTVTAGPAANAAQIILIGSRYISSIALLKVGRA